MIAVTPVMRAVAILCLLARVAAAGGYGAARVGVAVTSGSDTSYGLGDDPTPSGPAPWVDGEAGYRTGTIVIAGFAGYVPKQDMHGLFNSTGHVSCEMYDTITDSWLEAGVRLRSVGTHGFYGVGAGAQYERKSTTCDATGMRVDAHAVHTLAELHTGYTFDPVAGMRPQLYMSLTFGAGGSEGTASLRLALGVQF